MRSCITTSKSDVQSSWSKSIPPPSMTCSFGQEPSRIVDPDSSWLLPKSMTNVTSPVKGSASPVRIVVVDDSHIWRQYICSVLDREPELQVVAEAATGWEAV